MVGEIGDGDGRVIPAVEDDFPPRRRRLARGEDARVFRGLGEARAGVRDGPQPAVMHAEVPRARAAHREAGVHEAAAVHGIRAARGIERLEDVHLAGEFRRVAVASVGMHDEIRVGRKLARGLEPAGDEGEFAERVAASVIPDPGGARRLVGGAFPSRRHDNAEGLHAAVNQIGKCTHA